MKKMKINKVKNKSNKKMGKKFKDIKDKLSAKETLQKER